MKNLLTFEEFINEATHHNPLNDKDMREEIVEPRLGKKYDSYVMFKDREYEKMTAKYCPKGIADRELIYTSMSQQGKAHISPDGEVIKATVVDNGSIVGAIYIKK